MNITTQAIRRSAMAVAAVAAVGALGACSAGASGSATPQAGSDGSTVAANSGVGQGSDGGARQNASTSGTVSTNGGGAANGGGHPNCTALKVSQTSPDVVKGSTSQWQLPITMTNQGSTACTVQGFPGVRLDGSDGTSWDLVRTNGAVSPVLLKPGEHVTAEITYLTATSLGSGEPDTGWHVTGYAVTPPNTTNTQTLPWPDALGLVKQDAATHPGTYVGPVHAG
jgi:hypothetical protein